MTMKKKVRWKDKIFADRKIIIIMRAAYKCSILDTDRGIPVTVDGSTQEEGGPE